MNMMSLEKFLQWFISHNTLVIEVLIFLTLLSIGLILVHSIFRKEPGAAPDHASTSNFDFEKTLRKVLDEAVIKPEAKATAALIQDEEENKNESVEAKGTKASSSKPPTIDPAVTKELEVAKKEIQAKEQTVTELKKQLEETQKAMAEVKQKAESDAASGNVSKDEEANQAASTDLEKRIKELEAKLQEYEVIEDDIANLSLYKSENNQLKKEIASLKDRFKSKAEEKGEASPLVGEFAAAIGTQAPSVSPLKKEAAPTANASEAPTPVPAPSGEVKADASLAPESTPPDPAPTAPSETMVSTSPTQEPAAVVNSNIEEKTETKVEVTPSEKTTSKADEVLGEINIEAIAQEMADQVSKVKESGEISQASTENSFESLGSVSAPSDTPSNSTAANLDDVFGQVDPDKLLAETAQMTEQAPAATESAKAGEEEVGQKLIDEFESFMKSG